MKTAFRYTLLMGLLIIPLFFFGVENKFPIMIGLVIGGSLAFLAGYLIIKRKNKKKNNDTQKS